MKLSHTSNIVKILEICRSMAYKQDIKNPPVADFGKIKLGQRRGGLGIMPSPISRDNCLQSVLRHRRGPHHFGLGYQLPRSTVTLLLGNARDGKARPLLLLIDGGLRPHELLLLSASRNILAQSRENVQWIQKTHQRNGGWIGRGCRPWSVPG
jgi:hypothetical protein